MNLSALEKRAATGFLVIICQLGYEARPVKKNSPFGWFFFIYLILGREAMKVLA